MTIILPVGIILIISVLSCKITSKTGLPILVGFILIGVFLRRFFDSVDVGLAERICNYALLFIIFAGGFQTDFAKAKPVLAVSATLSTLGVVLTAAVITVFAHFVLRMELYAAILLGAVLSPTDAASVFSVLASKKLFLKKNLDRVLEMESGSNDPFAYMLTVVFLAVATGASVNVPLLLLQQILVGVAVGLAAGLLGRRMIKKLNVEIDGLESVLIYGVALFIYGMAVLLHGNGFLAVYIGGILLGNSQIPGKVHLSRTCSSVSMLMQILLFIVLGLLWVPSSVITVLIPGLIFAAFLFVVARPLIVFLLMKIFRYQIKDVALVSWAGFKGASSIVFATYILAAGLPYGEYLFSIVFLVCLLSVILQGSLLAPLAKKLGLTE